MVVNSHALPTVPVYKKNRIAPLLCVFETTIIRQSLINIPGKADSTLCASHVFVTLEAIIHDFSVSDGTIPASDFGGSKADMPGYNCSAQCFEAWYAAHLTTCVTQSSIL